MNRDLLTLGARLGARGREFNLPFTDICKVAEERFSGRHAEAVTDGILLGNGFKLISDIREARGDEPFVKAAVEPLTTGAALLLALQTAGTLWTGKQMVDAGKRKKRYESLGMTNAARKARNTGMAYGALFTADLFTPASLGTGVAAVQKGVPWVARGASKVPWLARLASKAGPAIRNMGFTGGHIYAGVKGMLEDDSAIEAEAARRTRHIDNIRKVRRMHVHLRNARHQESSKSRSPGEMRAWQARRAGTMQALNLAPKYKSRPQSGKPLLSGSIPGGSLSE